ncbi:MAG: glutaredoxin family protein [Burkholderiaceae bacterium]
MLVLAALVLGMLAAVQGLQALSAYRVGAQVASSARPGDIQMVSSVTCVYCAQARAWFTEHRVPFSECYIERDEQCAAAYRALRSPGTPVLVVRGQVQRGFSARAVARALESG